jgi:hypothetical protein
MLKYNCFKCNKSFNKKNHLDNHLQKKKPCIDVEKVNEQTNDEDKNDEIRQNPCKIPAKSEKSLQNDPIFTAIHTQNILVSPTPITNLYSDIYDIKKNNNIICDYCDMTFTRKDNLTKHINERCKNKKHIDNLEVIKSKINNTVIMSNEKYEKLISDNVKLIEILEEYKNLIKDTNLLKHSIPSTINNNSNTNNTNNGSINNGIVNNGDINSGNTINIVQFGKEDISKCNLIEMMNVFLQSTGGNIMSNMLKYLNFNPDYPQNFNILITDLARENVKIHNGKKFVTKKFKTVKNDILNVLSAHIAVMCNNYIENPKIKKSENILSKINVNNISVKLINDDDITPLLKYKNKCENDDEDISDIDDLTPEQKRKLTHFESKRQGLQEITSVRLKDELYNNRDLVINHHSLLVK